MCGGGSIEEVGGDARAWACRKKKKEKGKRKREGEVRCSAGEKMKKP